jgi:hypothetical protein
MPKDTPVCCGVKGIVAAVARATEAGTFMGFRSGTSTGKSFGITTAISLPPPQSDDLNAAQLSAIRATGNNSCHERNAHAHKTKLESEEGDSHAEIEIHWESSRENEKAESGSQKGCSDEEGTGSPASSASCPDRSAGVHTGLTVYRGKLRPIRFPISR